jgi:hypothetical protein
MTVRFGDHSRVIKEMMLCNPQHPLTPNHWGGDPDLEIQLRQEADS